MITRILHDVRGRQILAVLSCVLFFVTGCTTKSSARSQARAAYMAGQAEAYRRMLKEQRTTVRFIGPVKNPEIEWTNDLTLMEALVQAEVTSRRNPREIILIRKNERIPVDVRALLDGEDVLLQPGDTIEIRP